MTNFRLLLIKLVICCHYLIMNTALAYEQSLRVAVASNFASVAKELATEFEQQHQVKLNWITAATGTLYQQIYHGAPYDVLFAADKLRPEKLAKEGKLIPESVLPYAIGQLSLVSAKYPELSTLELIKKLSSFKKIAIANPDSAPYGKAAKQWLMSNGLWQDIQSKVIIGINVGQTFLQVRSKGADAGFVATSQLIANNLAQKPDTLKSHHQLVQYAGVLSNSKHPTLASALIAFFRQPKTQNKLANLGYLPVI